MDLYLETGYTSLHKYGEELCGDKVEYFTNTVKSFAATRLNTLKKTTASRLSWLTA